ncbi:MAG: tetratricopeptide repeat protein [Gemmatimonadetes bacterium]|nr:tetratricopeptide repeat protein [Gemmatimonadota bacterium]
MPRLRTSLVLTASLLLGGCATAPAGPVVSPTGIVYELGVPPTETRFSQTAALYLRQQLWDRALEQALLGIEAGPSNPVHYFLAGSAQVGLGDLEAADQLWREAQRIYPAYELEIEPTRETVWAERFNAGVEAYLAGHVEEAIAAWEEAAAVYDLRPDVHTNLGVILAEIGDYERAAETYRRGLAGLDRVPATHVLDEMETQERIEARKSMESNLAQILLATEEYEEAELLIRGRLADDPTSVDLRVSLGVTLSGLERDAEASEIYSSLLSNPDLTTYQLTQIGSSLFRTADFPGAIAAFGRVTEQEPDGRDGWFNYANALLAEGQWDALVPTGMRLVEVDPLTESSALISARAEVERGDEQAARAMLERLEGLPILLDGLQLWHSGTDTRVRGAVVGHGAEPGMQFQLRFTFYTGTELLGEQVLQVAAPARGERSSFSVSFPRSASAYRYALIH